MCTYYNQIYIYIYTLYCVLIIIIQKSIEEKEKSELDKIYSNLSPWQIVKIARHPQRPKTKDYIQNVFDNFTSLYGDRLYSEDNAVISGMAFLDQNPVLVLGTEKGHDMKSRIKHNFGMAKPEGYRKSQRIMKLASKLNLPLICFIDTSGAYPGKDAEERGQAEAIAQSMKVALNCEAPCISVVIGEGGSEAFSLASRTGSRRPAAHRFAEFQTSMPIISVSSNISCM